MISGCGGGSSSSTDFSGVPEPNNSPVFTSGSVASLMENDTTTQYVAQATDADGDTVTYTIKSVIDGDLFSIDKNTGEVSFKSAPDFENPLNKNGDNTYQLIVVASDGVSGSSELQLNITVLDESKLSAEISFPTPNSNVGHLTKEFTVSGNILDEEDGEVLEADISNFTINEQTVSFNRENPSRWKVQIPVNNFQQKTNLSLNLDSTSGDSFLLDQDVLHSRVNVRFEEITGWTIDHANDRLIIIDRMLDKVFAVGIDSGERELISVFKDEETKIDFYGTTIALNNETDQLVVESRYKFLVIDQERGDVAILAEKENEKFPRGILIDGENNRALSATTYCTGIKGICSSFYGELVETDIWTGYQTILSRSGMTEGESIEGAKIGLGPVLIPQDIALDKENNRTILTASNSSSIFTIDNSTGDRSVLIDNEERQIATGFISLDESNETLLNIGTETDNEIVNLFVQEVDLTDGSSQLVINHPAEAFGSYDKLLIDTQLNKAFVASNSNTYLRPNEIYTIDLETGENDIFASSEGPTISDDSRNLYDSVSSKVLRNLTSEGLEFVNLSDGSESIITFPVNDYQGYSIASAGDLVFDSSNNRIFVQTGYRSAGPLVISINLSDGTFSEISGEGIGTGRNYYWDELAFDEQNNRLFASYRSDLYTIDLTTGDRNKIETSGIGLSTAVDLTYDPLRNLIYFSDFYLKAVLAINPDNGNITILSSSGTGTGPQLSPLEIALDKSKDNLIVLDHEKDAVFSIDLNSKHRTVISSDSIGQGPKFHKVSSVSLDSKNNRIFVSDTAQRFLFVVDLATGDRSVVAE